MKKILVAFLFLGFVVGVQAGEGGAGFGVYSDGYRLGMVTKFSTKGMFIKSGEGQMLLGRDSSPYNREYECDGGKKCTEVINPWYFSAERDDADSITGVTGEYAWIHYNQARIKSPNYDTEYLVNKVGNPSRDNPPTCSDPSFVGHKSDGIRAGRLVKVSQKGTMSKTYEVMIQVGNAGNQFKHMSIKSEQMYNCAVEVLKSARMVKVHYTQSWFQLNPFGNDTSYAIIKIEPVGDI